VTLADIGHANALAHEVLGRSLDELPPQTRKLLAAIQQLVEIKAQALDGALQAVRFSRAEVRQHIGLSDTQCRVHLERLCNLEYLLVHRGGRGQCFEYELLFDGQPQADAPHLAGLIDVTKIQGAGSSTIVASRGKGGMNAEPSRVQRALETASTRVASTGVDTAPLLDVGSESRHPGHHGRPNGALYPAVPLAAKG
jgi:DNA primase